MDDTGSDVRLGFWQGAGGSFWNGKMAGGPIGPFFTQDVLTAAQVADLYALGQAALDL